MNTTPKSTSNSSPTKKQLVIIFFLSTALFVGVIIKIGRDYHWWLPKTEITSNLSPEDIEIKLDINSAPWYELVLLPKLGEVKAKAIVAYREKHGSFQRIDELDQVKGIGKKMVKSISEFIQIGTNTTDRWKNHSKKN